MAQVKIEAVLSKDTKQAYEEARTRAATLADEHQRAEGAAFMALMAQIGVNIGDTVVVKHFGWRNTEDIAILIKAKRFAKVKKDGTASAFELHVYAPYTVEKYNPPE